MRSILVLSPGFPRPTTRNIPGYFFLGLASAFGSLLVSSLPSASPSSSFLPFLMTSGSAGAPSTGTAAASAGAGSASTLMVTTCAITASGGLISFIEPLMAMSDARLLCPIISSRHVHGEVFRNLVGQALDFDLAGDEFEQPALHLDARRLAVSGDRYGHGDALGEIDALQVHVQQVALDGVVLPVHHHHRRGLAARDAQIENRVVSRLAVQNLRNLAGAYRYRDGVLAGAVNDGGDHSLARSRRASFLPREARASAATVCFVLIASPYAGGKSDERKCA